MWTAAWSRSWPARPGRSRAARRGRRAPPAVSVPPLSSPLHYRAYERRAASATSAGGWALPVVRPRRRPRQLELDAVGIEEEDGVVALAVLGVVPRPFRDGAAQIGDAAGGRVQELARGRLEADVVQADPVAVDRERRGAVGRLRAGRRSTPGRGCSGSSRRARRGSRAVRAIPAARARRGRTEATGRCPRRPGRRGGRPSTAPPASS